MVLSKRNRKDYHRIMEFMDEHERHEAGTIPRDFAGQLALNGMASFLFPVVTPVVREMAAVEHDPFIDDLRQHPTLFDLPEGGEV